MSGDGVRATDHDRLRRVEALYHQIVGHPSSEREAALLAACPDDAEMRDEIRSLLDQPDSGAGFLSSPAMEVAAGSLSNPATSLTGRRIGVFEVRELLGVGGMGEVYRARDSKLGRDVAIKILPDAFAQDADRVARFKREARVLASLNHPNIAAIHGLEELEGRLFLVLELVAGEDLSQRLRHGAIPLDQAIAIARQIAEGLEEAHEKGVVHRDLKPANIKVAPDGKVTILDFGLARAYFPEPVEGEDAATSRTRTRPTEAGRVIGTAGYMAPEQVRGQPLDRRADIWSFGVVLFEMLTGRWLFQGDTSSDTLAAVLTTEPAWSLLPEGTPASVRSLLERCLDRDVKHRLRDIGEARIALARPSASIPISPSSAVGRRVGGANLRPVLPWLAAGALLLASSYFLSRPPAPDSQSRTRPRTLLAHIGADASLYIGWSATAVLSPDGATLAFVAQPSGSKQRRLFVRALHELQATALLGTEGAEHPFFSPDGQWIAFFASGKLKKVAVAGGRVASLCDAPRGRGGSWAEDGTIIFAPNIDIGFQRVSADGGKPVPLGADGDVVGTHRWPQVLPGGRGVVFTRSLSPFATFLGFEEAGVAVAPLPSGPPKLIVKNAYYGQYLPSGHLIYVQRGRLFAVRFDINSLEVKGQPAPILEAVGASRGSGGAQVAFSSEGTLVYLPESVYERSIDWMTRAGERSPLHEGPLDWTNPRLSPDGKKLALDIYDGKQRDIWVFDLERNTRTQLTFDPANDLEAVWSPDGRRIVFSSDRGQTGITNLYWMNSDGTTEARRLTRSLQAERAGSWHPGGQWIAFDSGGDSKTREDLRLLPVREDRAGGLAAGEPVDFLKSPAREARPMFSPDGQWIAYSSDEPGNVEILVRPFPGPGGQWRVSRKGGTFPRWAPHGPYLLFTERDLVMFANYGVQGASFWSSEPEPWSPTGYFGSGAAYPYDVHPDGRRLVVNVDQKQNSRNTLAFTFGFFDYLKDLLPDDEANTR